jgi:hypothetical protein
MVYLLSNTGKGIRMNPIKLGFILIAMFVIAIIVQIIKDHHMAIKKARRSL